MVYNYVSVFVTFGWSCNIYLEALDGSGIGKSVERFCSVFGITDRWTEYILDTLGMNIWGAMKVWYYNDILK